VYFRGLQLQAVDHFHRKKIYLNISWRVYSVEFIRLSAKNITIYMPGEVVEKMETLKDVNWSKIAREAIEDYVNTRFETLIAPEIVERFKKEMHVHYAEGRQYAAQLIIPELSFKQLSKFFDTATERAIETRDNRAMVESAPVEAYNLDVDAAAREIITSHFKLPKDESSKFYDGAYSVIRELWDTINKKPGM
jgi:hypothetical protein